MYTTETLPSFSDIPYVRPNVENIQRDSEAMIASLQAATSESEAISIVHNWNRLRTDYGTNSSLAEVHYTQDVSNIAAKTEKTFFDNVNPTVSNLNIDVSRQILASPFRTAIEAEFGTLFLRRLEAGIKTISPSINDLLVEESELCNRFNEIQASAKIEFEGNVYNLSSIGVFGIDKDRERRKKAASAQYGFIGEHKEELDAIFDRLVKLRTEKARRLGYPSYIEYRYVEFGRIDYSASDVEIFRRSVVEHVVPVVERLRKAQAERIGVESVEMHDEKLQFADGNPVAHGDHDWIVERAKRMYSELSSETREFFNLMLDKDLLDLRSRDNKATGGYCTSFASFGLPFIFANFNQTTHDIEVLTHEAGHAFQAYRSRSYTVPEYRWPTAEACEIHSMGMEFLTWPWMQLFFEDQIDKFRFYHLQGALLFLPYGCAVDHFQHWIYANPNATPAERNQAWKEMESIYLPWRKTEAIPEAAEGRQWQFQRHIYESPFYYIDYALAQTCALQFWQRSIVDAKQAFADYLRICNIGGSQPFLGIVESGNLQSPFEPATLPAIVRDVEAWLKTNYTQYFGTSLKNDINN